MLMFRVDYHQGRHKTSIVLIAVLMLTAVAANFDFHEAMPAPAQAHHLLGHHGDGGDASRAAPQAPHHCLTCNCFSQKLQSPAIHPFFVASRQIGDAIASASLKPALEIDVHSCGLRSPPQA